MELNTRIKIIVSFWGPRWVDAIKNDDGVEKLQRLKKWHKFKKNKK
jgi:hypothetical protein